MAERRIGVQQHKVAEQKDFAEEPIEFVLPLVEEHTLVVVERRVFVELVFSLQLVELVIYWQRLI